MRKISREHAAKLVCLNCCNGVPRDPEVGNGGRFTHAIDGQNVWCDASGLFGTPLYSKVKAAASTCSTATYLEYAKEIP